MQDRKSPRRVRGSQLLLWAGVTLLLLAAMIINITLKNNGAISDTASGVTTLVIILASITVGIVLSIRREKREIQESRRRKAARHTVSPREEAGAPRTAAGSSGSA